MGMFDKVLCNHEFFGSHKGEVHQTKSLHPLGGALELYEITPAGRLEFLEYRTEDHSDPNAEGVLRLGGSQAMVFTGGRRDLDYHGWLNLGPFGRAKFTDETIVAFRSLNSTEAIETNRDSAEQSLRQPNLDAGRLKIGSELFRIGAEVGGIDLEFPKRIEPIDTDNYLRTFFRELDRLKPPQLWARSHAITYQQASICVLISVGDCRRKVFVESLDPDPSEAAQKVMAAWRKLKEQNEVKDFE